MRPLCVEAIIMLDMLAFYAFYINIVYLLYKKTNSFLYSFEEQRKDVRYEMIYYT
jgi:hypothetical protein